MQLQNKMRISYMPKYEGFTFLNYSGKHFGNQTGKFQQSTIQKKVSDICLEHLFEL